RDFIKHVRDNVIADIMASGFASRWGRAAGPQEFQSWQESLGRVCELIEIAGARDTFVALEYQVPYNDSRIDCFLFGKSNSSGNVLLIELKQWANVEALPESGNFVETYTGGLERIVAHPSQQVRGYYRYLMGFIAAFEGTGSLELFGCAYCHNYEKRQGQGL